MFNIEKIMLPCLTKRVFGIDCPGCGMQRAINFLLQGDMVAAFKMFPAIYTLILLFVFLGLHLIDKTRNYSRIVVAMAIANGVIMIISYIYKMTNQTNF